MKAVKLLLWAGILNVSYLVFSTICYRMLDIPDLPQALTNTLQGQEVSTPVCWLSLVATFVDRLLRLAVTGHVIVACCRFSGFCIPRNTYRPLEATTISEFWNRYYFYFKELLVDLFFFPTFSRCLRKHTRLRIAFATFMAAGVGNFIFHFIRDIRLVAQIGILHDLIYAQTYAFYCLLLSAGICLSQLHRVGKRSAPAGRLRIMLGRTKVIMFYLLLSVFADDERTYTLYQHIVFFMHLFGVSLT